MHTIIPSASSFISSVMCNVNFHLLSVNCFEKCVANFHVLVKTMYHKL